MLSRFPQQEDTESITELHEHQTSCIDQVNAAIAEGHRRIVVQAPTGSGKTLMAVMLLDDAVAMGRRVIFTVPALGLIEQTVRVLRKQGLEDIGVMQAYHELTNWDMPIQVCSVQTLLRRKIPEAALVIIDECHIWFQFYAKWFADPAWMDVPFIGLSATPWTRGLGAWYTKLIIAATTQELINERLLSDFKVFAPFRPDLSKVRTVAGDYHEGDLTRLMNTNVLVADVVNTWKLRGEDRPTLCFAVDCAHAKALQTEFVAAGVPADYQDASTKDEERLTIRDRFHRGVTKVVCNVGTLTTGVDWDVRCIIFARPTKSEMLFVQVIGRGLRTAPGKDHCLILDHSDNHHRLGFVTDIHHAELLGGHEPAEKKAREVPLPKTCKQCQALIPPRTMVCPWCGYEAPPLNGKLVFADGELVELERVREERKRNVKVIDVLRSYGKQMIYSQLLFIARERGYKDGWTSHKYRQIFEVWPVGLANQVESPSATLLSWLKAQAIAWAKSPENPRNRHGGTFTDYR